MKLKGLLSLALVLVVVMGVYFLSESKQKRETAQKDKNSQVLLVESIHDTKVITLSGRHYPRKITLEKTEPKKDWQINTPIKTKACNDSVVGMINGLSEARIEKRIKNPGNLADFGLTDPWVRLSLTSSQDKKQVLLWGNLSPAKDYIYVKPKNNEEIWLVSQNNKTYLKQRLFNLRDKKCLDFLVSDVKKIQLHKNGQKKISLVQKKGKNLVSWVFSDETQADSKEISDLLFQIHGLRALEFLDVGINLPKMGLQKPSAKIILTMAEGQKNGIIGILIGGRDLEGKARYLRRISGGPVMAVKSADLRALHLTKHALAQRKALSVQKDNIIGLVVKTGDNSFSFKKKNRLWQQKKPFKSDKKGIIAEGIIWELDNLKWERILPADKKYGFEKPRYSITINNKHESSNDDSKNKNVVLLVGDIDPVSGLLAAKIKGQNKILGLKPAFLKKLP